MAGIELSSLILDDRWPGVPNPNAGIPTDGWDNTISCYKTTSAADLPTHPIGEKRMAYSDNSWAPGWYTMMYLMYHSYESGATYDVSADISDGLPVCTHADGSTAAMYSHTGDNSTIPYYVVTRCITTAGGDVDYTRKQLSPSAYAVPCWSAESDGTACFTQGGYGDSFGWFWVGGVCPCKDITFFDTANATSTCAGIGACCSGAFDTQAKGPIWFCTSDGATTGYLTNDLSVFLVIAGDISYAPMHTTPLGWSCMTAL